MRSTQHCLAATLVGLAAILTVGCNEPVSPTTTGTVLVTVSTVADNSGPDPDGYTLSIDGGPGEPVGINASLTIGTLPTGTHFFRLDGLASNCAVTGTNPRSVNVIAALNPSPIAVSFSVSCSVSSNDPGNWDY